MKGVTNPAPNPARETSSDGGDRASGSACTCGPDCLCVPGDGCCESESGCCD